MSNQKLEDLKAKHAEVYKQFAPHVREYSKLAAEVLNLQVDIIKEMLRFDLNAVPAEKVLILKISARETLENVTRALENLKAVEIVEVVYDPARFEFLIFGKP